MGWLALGISLCALVCAVLPGAAVFVALGLAVLAVGTGLLGYRRRGDAGAARLAGAGGLALGLMALVLAASRYGLILLVIRHLEGMF